MRFRLIYGDDFEIINARDIFAAAEHAKKAYRQICKMPCAIQEVLAFPDNPVVATPKLSLLDEAVDRDRFRHPVP
jgi:hypothetical protein